MELELWIGTYTKDIVFGTGQVLHGKGHGIYNVTFDTRTQKYHNIVTNKNIVNPSYVVQSEDGEYVFAVNETKEYNGMTSGYVSSFKVNKNTKELTWVSSQPTNGTDPCHLSINSKMTHLFVANFMSGSISMYQVGTDGTILDTINTIQHKGHSIHPSRQKGPHAHAVMLSVDERFLFVPDLGLDAVIVYEIDYELNILVKREELQLTCKKGSGPRSITFHQKIPYAYCINELDSTIDVCSYDDKSGILTFLYSYSTLPKDFDGNSTCADIHISTCGNYLIGSNRGHDSLVCYKIDQKTGLLTTLGYTPTGGICPRNFYTYESSILVANQDSDTITIFSLNEGDIINTGESIKIPTPVCINNQRY